MVRILSKPTTMIILQVLSLDRCSQVPSSWIQRNSNPYIDRKSGAEDDLNPVSTRVTSFNLKGIQERDYVRGEYVASWSCYFQLRISSWLAYVTKRLYHVLWISPVTWQSNLYHSCKLCSYFYLHVNNCKSAFILNRNLKFIARFIITKIKKVFNYLLDVPLEKNSS